MSERERQIWAYIATPDGASLSRTFGLARGSLGDNFQLDHGFIHRRLFNRKGVETPNLKEMKAGDEVVLMYDLFNAGVVYPIATFQLATPRGRVQAKRRHGVKSYELSSDRRCPMLARLNLGLGDDLFEPDYEDTGAKRDDDGHLALVLTHENGGYRPPPAEVVGKVFLREPAISTPRRSNTIEPWSALADRWVNERDGRHHQLRELAPVDSHPPARTVEVRLWNRLDGRSRQLIATFDDLRSIREAGRSPVTQPTLAAYVLCALVEYELCKLLASAGRTLINPDLPLDPDFAARIDVNRADEPAELKRFLAPEAPTHNWAMGKLLDAAHQLCRGLPATGAIQALRNRMAHSYLITSAHLEQLSQLVFGKRGFLARLYGDQDVVATSIGAQLKSAGAGSVQSNLATAKRPAQPQDNNVGNLGDVAKHVALIALYRALIASTSRPTPIISLDSHAYLLHAPLSAAAKADGWLPGRSAAETLKLTTQIHEGLQSYDRLQAASIRRCGDYLCSPGLALRLLPREETWFFWAEKDMPTREQLKSQIADEAPDHRIVVLPGAGDIADQAVVPGAVGALIDPFSFPAGAPETARIWSAVQRALARATAVNAPGFVLLFHYQADEADYAWPKLAVDGWIDAPVMTWRRKPFLLAAYSTRSFEAACRRSLGPLGFVVPARED